MESGRDDLAEREKFNAWFHTTGLVVLVDPRTKRIEICPGRIEENRLAKYWDSEWILDHLTGEDRERYLADVKKLKNSDIDNEIAIAKSAEEERRRNRVPMTPSKRPISRFGLPKPRRRLQSAIAYVSSRCSNSTSEGRMTS